MSVSQELSKVYYITKYNNLISKVQNRNLSVVETLTSALHEKYSIDEIYSKLKKASGEKEIYDLLSPYLKDEHLAGNTVKSKELKKLRFHISQKIHPDRNKNLDSKWIAELNNFSNHENVLSDLKHYLSEIACITNKDMERFYMGKALEKELYDENEKLEFIAETLVIRIPSGSQVMEEIGYLPRFMV